MEIEDAAKEYAEINEDKAANSAHSYSKYDIADAYQQGYNFAVSRLRWIPVGENTTVSYDYEIKNYRIEPQFIPNPKIRGKYKRNLKYK